MGGGGSNVCYWRDRRRGIPACFGGSHMGLLARGQRETGSSCVEVPLNVWDIALSNSNKTVRLPNSKGVRQRKLLWDGPGKSYNS